MILLGIFSILNFLYYFFQPQYKGDTLLYILLCITILYSILKKLYVWYNYSNISIPNKPDNEHNFSVDILTTYYPGEPRQMIITTLEAINNITYPHTAYLCDEADDPFLKDFCKENDIVHVTRDNRINAKAGNINNALKKVAAGDICVILDPDHIPEPDFLDPILPHFADPDIGFVQIVQSYYNIKESLVARGAAEQTFQFYGPMMMTQNAYGTVNAIGANCVFRRAALDSIGGHAPGLCEDMHTTMLLYAKGWKAVYLPQVLAKGLAPSNLTNFFKQQLKWSRGTFDLLAKVYPRIFNKLTGRQKIHFAVLPMHYFAGVICLINFLIPVLALLFSTTPWEGNIIDFGLVILPVAASSLLIRTFIQKWVIEKKERGFHLVGGLLHINTWWIYILGFVYTLLDKKIPYLPTPKENEWNTNFKIIIPNAVVAVVSVFAIIYGLSQDLTPFSIIMAGFAFFNTFIMLFGIYLSVRVTNRNRILRENLKGRTLSLLDSTKDAFYWMANSTFAVTRLIALPLLLAILILSMSFKQQKELMEWEQVQPSYTQKKSNNYLGIFHPAGESGISDLEEINSIEARNNINFNIISLYLAWNEDSIDNFPDDLLTSIIEKNAIPMVTWEPWASSLPISDSIEDLREEKKVFQYITKGYFDEYIREFADRLGEFNKPVYLRFAHEFDNPQYPWSSKGNNTPEEFKAAWKHVYQIFKEEGADLVMFVWNPWKAEQMSEYYPGESYVDWIGITALNYGPLNNRGQEVSFSRLYQEFHNQFYWFTRKPVMLAEFGSLDIENTQEEWTRDAMNSINSEFDEISAIVIFNSAFDKNIPANNWYKDKYIDWTMDSIQIISNSFDRQPVNQRLDLRTMHDQDFVHRPVTMYDIKGVRYKKGSNWQENYDALTKDALLEDFKLIREAGLNTIHITGGNIYDYNILKYSEKSGLKVIFEFEVDNSTDFINDREELEELRRNIINEVQDLKDDPHVIAYSFRYDLERFFTKPLLFFQRTAYLEWLQSLANEIKTIDPEKSLIIDLQLNDETGRHIEKIAHSLPVDSYGLIINEEIGPKELSFISGAESRSVFISSIGPENILREKTTGREDFILRNWQDVRISNYLTFDGLVDFRGRKKGVMKEIANVLKNKNGSLDQSVIKILNPAEPLFPGSESSYHAVVFKDGQWQVASRIKTGYSFEWNLVKHDDFGNPLALKKVGEGPQINLKIPENYKNFDLMLIARKKSSDYVISKQSMLHTPAESAR